MSVTTAYELPGSQVYPEGIAADPYTGELYAGSYRDGTIYRMTPGRPAAEQFLRAVVYRVTPRQLALAKEHGGRAPLTSWLREEPPSLR